MCGGGVWGEMGVIVLKTEGPEITAILTKVQAILKNAFWCVLYL